MDPLAGIGVFVRVAEAGNLSRVARELGLTTSAVSKQIRRLEERLGARLLHRTTRKVALTEAGAAFHARCARILRELEEAELAAAELSGQPRGVLRVNAPLDFGRLHLGPALADFLAAHPDLRVELALADGLVDPLEEGFDVSIRIAALADSSLVARRLAPSRRVICAAPAYLARHGTPRAPEDLSRHNCLGYSYLPSRCEWPFRGGDVPRRVAVSGNALANNGGLLRELVLAGAGLALLPTFLVGPDLAAGRLVSVLDGDLDADTAIYALHPHRDLVPAKTRAFIDFLARRFGPRPAWDGYTDRSPKRRRA